MTSSSAPAVTAAAPATAINMPGQCGRQRLKPTMTAIVATDTAIVVPSNVGRVAPQHRQLVEQLARLGLGEREPEQILELAREDDDGDTGRESDRHGIGDELDVGAELEKADRREHEPGQHRREQQPVETVRLRGGGDEHDERAGRAADLEAAAAERGDEEAADDRGVQPLRGRGARSDRDRHRQRQRHDGHGQPRERIGAQVLPLVAFAKDGDELRGEELREARSRGLGKVAFMGVLMIGGTPSARL